MEIDKPTLLILIGSVISLVGMVQVLINFSFIWCLISIFGSFVIWMGVGLGMSNFLIALDRRREAVDRFNKTVENFLKK